MLGEKSADKVARSYLRQLGHGAEAILGWDTGDGFITGGGQAWQGKLLLVATPNHLFVLPKRRWGGQALRWSDLASAETRQDKWKSSFVVYETRREHHASYGSSQTGADSDYRLDPCRRK